MDAEIQKQLLFELLSNPVFEGSGSLGDLASFGDFDPLFERDDFGKVVKAA